MRRKLFLLFAVLILCSVASGTENAFQNVKEVAQNWASQYYQGRIDQGTPYYASDQTVSAWVFTVYRKSGPFPSSEEITDLVSKYRRCRLQAEAYLKQSIATNDREGIAEANRLIQNYWAAMRNAETFATIFVTERPQPHVAMAYPGLPPHYVAVFDAEEKAKQALSVSSVNLVHHHFLNPVGIYAKFQSDNKCIYINLTLLDRQALPALGLLTSHNASENETITCLSPNPMAKSMSTIEVIIEGVPAYNSYPAPPDIPCRSCRQISAAMVLGYWDDIGYDKLIDGGGSDYMGQVGVDGWLNLVEELNQEMGYGAGVMSVVDDAIMAVCNDPTYGNNYEFQASYESYTPSQGIPTDWDDYCAEIDGGKPFVYQFGGTVTVDTNGVPATWHTNHAVAAIGYKKTGNSSTEKWRIVHYNSEIVDDPCYMCEADMNVYITSIVKVIPGGGHIIWVDWRNTGTEDGSYEHPYNTIMEGIDAATNDYTVRVRSGTYNESVQIKTGIDLIGAGSSNTTIEVSGYLPAVAFENVSNAKLSGFSLKGYIGVKCDNSDDVAIEDNLIHGSWAGIYLYESSPEIKHNIVTGNDFGIYAWSHSDPEVYDAYNDISGNDCGVRCSSNSEPALGYYYDYIKGKNNINNTTWDVYAYSTSQTIFAIYNYWQNGGTPKVHHESSSYSIEYEPMLEENPLGKASVNNPVAINLRGLRLFYEKRYREALREFRYVIDNYPHHPVAPFALDNLIMTYKKMKRREEVLPYLRSLAQLYPDALLGGMALEFIIPFELEQGDLDGAITRINSLRDRFSRDELGKNVFFKLGMIYKYHMRNREEAEEVFRQIIERYPKEEIARLAEMELHTMDLSLPKGRSSAESEEMPFLLSQNYPNPGNPSTTITFTLPTTTHITLEIYNLLGQRVRTLVEGVREAGSHTAVWDGRDESGNTLSSGVYLYRLRAGEAVQTKKMLLLR